MVAQPFVFVNYRRYYGESELPYNEEADKHAKDPKKFYEFLKTKGAEATFEEYFTKDEKSLQETLKDIRKQKAIDLIEDILTKRQIYNDVFAKQAENTKSIDEIKNDNKLIFGQLDKILEFIKYNMDTGEKHLILSHIMENLK